jgi:protein-arginine kinase activator protein McsA
MSNIEKPSTAEEEYFARENAERLRKIAHEQRARLAEAQRNELRKQHWMRCPKCGMELKEVRHRDLLIDKCFSCGGTYLDAGELEKLSRPESHKVIEAVLNWFSHT